MNSKWSAPSKLRWLVTNSICSFQSSAISIEFQTRRKRKKTRLFQLTLREHPTRLLGKRGRVFFWIFYCYTCVVLGITFAKEMVMDHSLSPEDRVEFLKGVNEAYRRLRQDPAAWQEYLDERAEWLEPAPVGK